MERFNGCLQGRFKIVRNDVFERDANFIISISNCCVILHNMLAELRLSGELEDEYDSASNRIQGEEIYSEFMDMPYSTGVNAPVPAVAPPAPIFPWSLNEAINSFLGIHARITDRDSHIELTKALAEHQWALKNSTQ